MFNLKSSVLQMSWSVHYSWKIWELHNSNESNWLVSQVRHS